MPAVRCLPVDSLGMCFTWNMADGQGEGEGARDVGYGRRGWAMHVLIGFSPTSLWPALTRAYWWTARLEVLAAFPLDGVQGG